MPKKNVRSCLYISQGNPSNLVGTAVIRKHFDAKKFKLKKKQNKFKIVRPCQIELGVNHTIVGHFYEQRSSQGQLVIYYIGPQMKNVNKMYNILTFKFFNTYMI